jgi:hypothetical protein
LITDLGYGCWLRTSSTFLDVDYVVLTFLDAGYVLPTDLGRWLPTLVTDVGYVVLTLPGVGYVSCRWLRFTC